jgi:hypothetical protein
VIKPGNFTQRTQRKRRSQRRGKREKGRGKREEGRRGMKVI